MTSTRPTILIIEDNMSNHSLYNDVFSQSGFDIEILKSADGDFLNEVKLINPDIISMDLEIGKGGQSADRDGYDAIELLSSDEQTKNIPVMVLSNFSSEERIAKAKQAGVKDFIFIQGHNISKIPDHFNRYLSNPKKYLPVHPLFRKED